MNIQEYDNQFNTAKEVRNIVTVDVIKEIVLKEYVSGSYDEKNSRLKQEISALSEIPKFFPVFHIPSILDAEFGEQPFIKMQFVSSNGNLKELIQSSNFTIYQSIVSQLCKDVKNFHKLTLLIEARPSDILSKANKYGERYLDIINKQKFEFLIKQLEGYGKVKWSKLHQDVKLSNILYISKNNYSLIDWEHYSFGSQQYEFATLFVSIVLLLKNEFSRKELLKLLSYLKPEKEDEKLFYLSLATRVLIEIGPALKRNEYGDSEQAKIFLVYFFNTCLDQTISKRTFSNFVLKLLNKKL